MGDLGMGAAERNGISGRRVKPDDPGPAYRVPVTETKDNTGISASPSNLGSDTIIGPKLIDSRFGRFEGH